MSEQTQEKAGFWEGAEIIHAYTRAQAIEDGFLVDLSELAREAGFKYPLAVTPLVWATLEPSEDLKAQGHRWEGRAWDMLTVLRLAIKQAARPDEVRFAPLFVLERGQRPKSVEFRAKCGPGDNGEPVITVMMPDED